MKENKCQCLYCKAYRYAKQTDDWTPLAMHLVTYIQETRANMGILSAVTGKTATCLSDEEDKVGSLLAGMEYDLEEAEAILASIDPEKVKIDGLLTIKERQ